MCLSLGHSRNAKLTPILMKPAPTGHLEFSLALPRARHSTPALKIDKAIKVNFIGIIRRKRYFVSFIS